MQMIFFRTDANHIIGMGHIMRCLSISDAISSSDTDITFILADDSAHQLITNRGYKAIVLQTDYRAMESELDSWPEATPDLIIVDSYFITETYLVALRKKVKGGKLVYIDDLASFPYPVDVLVNYNAYAQLSTYEELYKNYTKLYQGTMMPKFILGPTYAPLRSMFRSVPRKIQKEKTENILISTGGSDELHLALSLINYLYESGMDKTGVDDIGKSGEWRFHFLLGAMNRDKEEIKSVASGMGGRVVLHENVTDMKNLITGMDLIVSAAGSTLYEICACGVPLITYSLSDNQMPGVEAFERLGLADSIGDLRDPRSIVPGAVMSGKLDNGACAKIFLGIEELSQNFERRCKVGIRMQEMIDGFGADRMVKEILNDAHGGVIDALPSNISL